MLICCIEKYTAISEIQYKISNRPHNKNGVYVVNSNMEIIGVDVQSRLNEDCLNLIRQNKGNGDKGLSFYKCSG